jgi:hypothetical protein
MGACTLFIRYSLRPVIKSTVENAKYSLSTSQAKRNVLRKSDEKFADKDTSKIYFYLKLNGSIG